MSSCGCYEETTESSSQQLPQPSTSTSTSTDSTIAYNTSLPGTPQTIRISKPENWNSLPLYKKIRHYGTQLTEIYGTFSDKLIAKDIIETFCREDEIKVARIIRVLDSPDDVSTEDICSNWILRASHAFGWDVDLDTSKSASEIVPVLHSWNKPYLYCRREYQYQFIRPRFFIEEKIVDKHQGITANPTMYMVRCIYGKPHTISVVDRVNRMNILYDTAWNKLNATKQTTEKPINLDKMLELSERLSGLFEFVRIDFNIGSGDDLYFNGFSFTPSGGNRVFSESLEMRLGEPWV